MIKRYLKKYIFSLENVTIWALLVVFSGAWLFAELADEVIEGDTADLDRAILMALRLPDDPQRVSGPLWFQEMMRDITGLGGVAVMTLITLSVLGFLIIKNKYHVAVYVAVSVTSGAMLSTILKAVFDRPRPDLVPHLSHVQLPSFPSGHSMIAAIVYLTLGVMLAKIEPDKSGKIFIVMVALILTVLVGISRVYMGVHWPTDVIAGWIAGFVWALLCGVLGGYLQKKGTIEKEL